MITASANVIFESGAIQAFTTPSMTLVPNLYIRSGDITCVVHIAATGTPTVTVIQKDFRTTKTAVDLKTGTGTGDSAKFLNAVEQVYVDYLVTLNGAIFTIV